MVNLLSNAVKFSSEGEVILSASAKPGGIEGQFEIIMSVQDNGIGIPDEDKHKLFQVFTQLDNSATRKHVMIRHQLVVIEIGRNGFGIVYLQKIG